MKLSRTIILLFFFCLATNTVEAQKMYGLVPGSAPSSLYLVDQTNAELDYIGYTGFHYCSCLDQNPVNYIMYAICNRENQDTIVLITIDLTSGVGTEIGPLGSNFREPLGIPGMSFRSDGELFAWNDSAGPSPPGNTGILYNIDINTGEAKAIDKEATSVNEECIGLAFSLTDSLYLFGEETIYLVDQTSSNLDSVSSLITCDAITVDVHPITGEFWSADDNPPGGVRPQVGRSVLMSSISANNLEIVDLDGSPPVLINFFTEAGEAIGVEAIAFAVDPLSVVPTMGEWSLWLFGLILFTTFVVFLYRMKRSGMLVEK